MITLIFFTELFIDPPPHSWVIRVSTTVLIFEERDEETQTVFRRYARRY